MNQSELKQIHEAGAKRGKPQVMISFRLTSDWLTKWREDFLPISKRSNAKPKQSLNYCRHLVENCFTKMLLALLYCIVSPLCRCVTGVNQGSI